MTVLQSRPNPLANAANGISDRTALVVSVLARLAGALGALYIASDQPYDRTQVFSVLLAALALASAYPLRGTIGSFLGGIGGGLLFFGGAELFEQGAALILIAAGIVVAGASGVMAHRAGKLAASVTGFFFGAGMTVAMVVGIALLVEG